MSPPSPTPNAEQLTVDAFVNALKRSGVLERAQLKAAIAAAPTELTAKEAGAGAFAEHLIKTGKLSRFQARKLLQGAYRGLVLGPYQILAPLGRGGMGTVYMARDGRNGRLVALKVLSARRARAEERTRSRFLREMELNKRVAHPNVALTYEVGALQDVLYIAMEFIPGKSLHRVVSGGGPLTVGRAARLLAEVAAGLGHAHEKGLIHRDLKPSNVMVTPNDHAKVLDLGLALVQGETADIEVVGGHGYIVGTMDYISPEQSVDPTKVDARSDIYSLGCTLYYALTGQPPFPGGTSQEKRLKHRTEEPTPLWQLRAGLPTPFVDWVGRLMAKDPAQRPPTALAVQDQLLLWSKDDAALPMDRPNDTNFRIAVAALKDVSNDSFLLEEIPAAEAAPVPSGSEAGSASELLTPSEPPAPRGHTALAPWILLSVVFGIPLALVLLSLCVTAVAWLIFGRH